MYQAAGAAQQGNPGYDPNAGHSAGNASGNGDPQYYDADYTEVVDDDKK